MIKERWRSRLQCWQGSVEALPEDMLQKCGNWDVGDD